MSINAKYDARYGQETDFRRRFGLHMSEIERRHRLSAKEFRAEYLLAQRPVILTGLTDDWPARNRWTLDSLRKSFGEKVVRVTRTDDDTVVMMPLSEYLDYLAQPADPRPLYLATWTIGSDNGNAALFRDYQVPEHFRPCWQTRFSWIDPHWEWLFIGRKGVRLGLHLDTAWSSAWNAVITGKKEVIAYPFAELAKVSAGVRPLTFVDAFEPDEKRFPDFREARGLYGELNPGELIFVPSKWIHQFNNVETGISVSHNWINQFNWRRCDEWMADEWRAGEGWEALAYRGLLRLLAVIAVLPGGFMR
jgi:histone arginine demethylase JMJD6